MTAKNQDALLFTAEHLSVFMGFFTKLYITTNEVAVQFLAGSKHGVSTSGRVDVPKTADGGRCEISTGTGDIEIEIE